MTESGDPCGIGHAWQQLRLLLRHAGHRVDPERQVGWLIDDVAAVAVAALGAGVGKRRGCHDVARGGHPVEDALVSGSGQGKPVSHEHQRKRPAGGLGAGLAGPTPGWEMDDRVKDPLAARIGEVAEKRADRETRCSVTSGSVCRRRRCHRGLGPARRRYSELNITWMRSPPSRRAAAATRAYPPPPPGRCASSTSTTGEEPCSTRLPGTSTGPRCSAGAKGTPASTPSAGWWPR